MHTLMKNITRFLLIVLLFPIMYQGIHIMYHHHTIASDMCSDEPGLYLAIPNERCYVGEFEFASFDEITSYLIPDTLTQFGEIILPSCQNNPCQFNGHNIALRAPPFIG